MTINDETGRSFSLEVYLDANNPALRDAGLQKHFYYVPQRVFLAKKQSASTEMGGGFCTFSTTFAIPPGVIDGVIAKLKTRDHPVPISRLGPFFNHQEDDPDPGLGIVPITNSTVVCAVQDPTAFGGKIVMTAQYSQKGSIEQHGISTFLITCNLFAAGEIASALKAGASPPFTVTNILKEAFYVNAVTAVVDVDVDKVYDSFSFAVQAGSFLGIDEVSANAAWSSCLTTGGVTTHMTQNQTVLDPSTAKWVNDNVDAMKKTAMDLVKQDIFDWDPSKADSKATTSGRGWFSEVFGGSAVSLKSDHERRGVHFNQTLKLDETISVEQAVSGDLNDLLPAVRANLNKYLFVIDIGEFFQKVQVAGFCAVNFGEKADDGTDLRDPLIAVQLEAGYPDFSSPVENGQPNLRMLDQGQHYQGQSIPKGPVSPAIWKAENASDFVNFSFLRLDNPVPGWPKDQVKLRRKLIFDGLSPRVNLSSAITPHDPAIAEIEELTTDRSPALTAAAVGYVFVRFWVTPIVNLSKPPPNITVTITPKIGKDTYPQIVVTKANLTNAIWEVFSDKYVQESEFTYTMTVEVDGPNFTDDPVIYSTPEPVRVPIPQGRIKSFTQLVAPLPSAPADKRDIINAFVKAAMTAPV
jgi:hypothetical protein